MASIRKNSTRITRDPERQYEKKNARIARGQYGTNKNEQNRKMN